MRIKWIRDKVGELSKTLASIRKEAERRDERLAQEISYVADDLALCAQELDIVVHALLARREKDSAKDDASSADEAEG